MSYTTLIGATDLAVHLADPAWAILDCRYYLPESERGRAEYQAGHIPGALYAHLKEDLAGPVVPGQTGRHPLPAPDALTRTFAAWGIASGVQVIAYDGSDGSMAAARLWWLLRWLGHEAVAVLDGGLPAWLRAGYPVTSAAHPRAPRVFVPQVRDELVLDTAAVQAIRHDPTYRLADVRAPARYRGETEPIDPVAGHIPGAVNAPYLANVDAAGHFLLPAALHAQYQALLGAVSPERTVFYCGSGVTSAHSLLALAHAGLGEGRLYPGSWSEWITDPARPVATGPA